MFFQELRLSQPASLGNGTRPAGTPLCRIVLAPGVELGEVLIALNNPHLCTFIDPGDDDPDEGPPRRIVINEITVEDPAEPESTESDVPTGTPIHDPASPIPEEYRGVLAKAGLLTVEDVIAYKATKDLTTIQGIGRKSAQAIEAALNKT